MPIPLLIPIGAALIGGVAAGAAAAKKKPAAPKPEINTFMQYQPEPTNTDEAEQATKQGFTDQQKKIAGVIILAVLGFVIYKYVV